MNLPEVRGRYRFDADLSKTNWFQVGGAADVLFKPADADDLAYFMQYKPADLPVIVLGVGSNVIIRDGGIEGVVIRLGRGFTEMSRQGTQLTVGAGCLDVHVAQAAAEARIAGLEFLSGIPGTIGGALAMNAGAYGHEISEVLEAVQVVTPEGEVRWESPSRFCYAYRHAEIPQGWIFTAARLRGKVGDVQQIQQSMAEIQAKREESQPIRERTGGSTFRNPEGQKAWRLIDEAGCRGLRKGDAQVSQKHCNFLINHGQARAADLEALGEAVRSRVAAQSGVSLQWEIKRLGRKENT